MSNTAICTCPQLQHLHVPGTHGCVHAVSDKPNEPKLTTERALELTNRSAWARSRGLTLSHHEYNEIEGYLRAFAEQATINDLADALLIYGQHYLSCDGSIGVDDCCECGLSDWLAKTRKLRPEYERAEDSLEAHREIAERDRTIKDLRRDLGVLEVSRDAYADTNIELRAALAAAEEKLKACERDLKDHMEQIKFVVKTCMDSREQSDGLQAAYLRDEILTRVDPLMMIAQRVIDERAEVPNEPLTTEERRNKMLDSNPTMRAVWRDFIVSRIKRADGSVDDMAVFALNTLDDAEGMLLRIDTLESELLRLAGPVCPHDGKRAGDGHTLSEFDLSSGGRILFGDKPHWPALEVERWLRERSGR